MKYGSNGHLGLPACSLQANTHVYNWRLGWKPSSLTCYTFAAADTLPDLDWPANWVWLCCMTDIEWKFSSPWLLCRTQRLRFQPLWPIAKPNRISGLWCSWDSPWMWVKFGCLALPLRVPVVVPWFHRPPLWQLLRKSPNVRWVVCEACQPMHHRSRPSLPVQFPESIAQANSFVSASLCWIWNSISWRFSSHKTTQFESAWITCICSGNCLHWKSEWILCISFSLPAS